jgi:hypothetical protein
MLAEIHNLSTVAIADERATTESFLHLRNSNLVSAHTSSSLLRFSGFHHLKFNIFMKYFTKCKQPQDIQLFAAAYNPEFSVRGWIQC